MSNKNFISVQFKKLTQNDIDLPEETDSEYFHFSEEYKEEKNEKMNNIEIKEKMR